MRFPKAQPALQLIGLLLLGAFAGGAVVHAERPGFVDGSVYSPNAATVSAVFSSLSADVVVLDGGLEAGLQTGMVCRVSRGNEAVGEMIIIESKSDRCAGLILTLVENQLIQAGDQARVKTLKNS